MKPFTCAGVWLFLVVTHYCKAQGHFQNVAFGKQCNQSSFYHFLPNRQCNAAVNGDTSGNYVDSSNCIHTGNGDWTPFWQVNLGQAYRIHHIVVWGRTDRDTLTRMSGCQIKVDGDMCYTFGNVSVTDNQRFNITCNSPRSGQVIRVEKNTESGTPWSDYYTINMCELEVYATNVCSDGYIGSECETPCGDGYWGRGCQTPCGRCSGGQSCDRQTGDCPAGCAAGTPLQCTDFVDGSWGSWTDYDVCSQSCGGGSQTMRRSCDNPAPVNGGAGCPGNDTDAQDCNALPCQVVVVETQSAFPVATVAGAAVGGVVVTAAIAAVIFFVFVRRRGRNTHDAPGTDGHAHRKTSSATSPEGGTTSDDNYEDVSGVGTVRPSDRLDGSCTNPDLSSSATSSATATAPGATVYQNVGDPSHDDPANYERLDVSTVGQRSVYSKLKKPKK